MERAEYHNLERVERDHWYYSGKRDLADCWIERIRPIRASDTLLDFGAGTGIFASRFLGRCRVRVLDAFPESREMLASRFPADAVLKPGGNGIPLADESVEFVTALDVLEHIADDHAAVAEIGRVLKVGGVFLATVPADMRLWSDWDEALHHVRRYRRDELAALFPTARWKVHHLAFTNVLAYPAVYTIRRLRRGQRSKTTGAGRSEDKVPPEPMNRLLRWLFVSTGKARWFHAPFGVSLIVVATRTA